MATYVELPCLCCLRESRINIAGSWQTKPLRAACTMDITIVIIIITAINSTDKFDESWLRKRLDGEEPCGLKYVSVDFDK